MPWFQDTGTAAWFSLGSVWVVESLPPNWTSALHSGGAGGQGKRTTDVAGSAAPGEQQCLRFQPSHSSVQGASEKFLERNSMWVHPGREICAWFFSSYTFSLFKDSPLLVDFEAPGTPVVSERLLQHG